ncbi:ankyrin repeat domain-containing protein 50 [Coprinopsis cinerea AmutBmut pab1-1]|nr:ankyrin repeat domain-containing protein 50 [Coprinopsis cinerea AmutBmut pab1-1]
MTSVSQGGDSDVQSWHASAELSQNSFILNDGSSETAGAPVEEEDDEDVFVYPGNTTSEPEEVPAPRPQTSHPSPAQLESLCAAASSGDLPQLKRLFKTATETNNIQPFSLANDASTRTGFTVLHSAASRGHLDIVVWLIENCGAMPDVEDREGETALHKAALNGHIDILKYLLPDRADVHARDADGWTALHNACSKGYLDIVRWLCERGGATAVNEGVSGVDVKSKDGWTPLMNAASKGHLPVVLYLLNKQSANPLVRNKWGETAYDTAAAVFEVWICEVLQQAEAAQWRRATTPYNPLLVHTTLPIILYENQRLDTRLKTVATSGGRPKFNVSGLGKQGRRAPFELKLLVPDEEIGSRMVPAWRSGVQLPARESPWVLPRPVTADSAPDSGEKSHFWLSDWTLDVTHPAVDAEEGWQYAQSFSDPDERWVAEKPMPLQRILNGSGIVAAGLNTASSSSLVASRGHPTWVRRRRWVRIMRRRLDIPPLPFLEPDGSMYYLDPEGNLIPYTEESRDRGSGGQELELMPPNAMLASARDYVARARYLVGNQINIDSTPSNSVEVRRAIAKLERATTELRQGIPGDEDTERRVQAEVLLNAYSRELERRRLAASSSGLLISDTNVDESLDDYDDDDDEFVYPGAEPSRSASRASGSTNDYFSQPGHSRIPADLTPQLAQAPDFRVPTHEAPQKVLTARWTSPPTPHQLHAQWERDEAVQQCRECQRRFNFINRRHHCRKCGRIFCDRCSSNRVLLDPSDIVHDPSLPHPPASTSPQRVCQGCYDEMHTDVPTRLYNSSGTALERIVVDHERLTVPGRLTRRQSSSQLSDLADCPVCFLSLDDVGGPQEQELHVKNCLEGGGQGPSSQAAKYLVYRLPAESTLLGVECVICLEEFVKGSTVARLSCFCSFHNGESKLVFGVCA